MFDYLFFFNFETSQKFEGALGFIMSIKEHKPENISADFVDGIATRLAEFKWPILIFIKILRLSTNLVEMFPA